MPPATVHLVCGPIGAGKTTRALELAAAHRGVFLGLDEWLATLYGPDMPLPLRVDWAAPRIVRCDEQMWRLARRLLDLGVDVIMDLGFANRYGRDVYRARARAAGALVRLHVVDADRDVRRSRVHARNQERGATFTLFVDDELFDLIDRSYEPPGRGELEP